MLIVTTRFSKKKAILTILLVGVLMAVAIIATSLLKGDPAADCPELADNTQRVAYLQSLGWEVNPEPLETLQFLLPEDLTEPYLSYNELQKEQGFDLSAYCGKQVARYTYAVTNYPGRPTGVQLNLYLCENLPVAGDVCCPGTNGFQETLTYPESDS